MDEVLPHIAEFKRTIAGTEFENIVVMVDGGINAQTALDAARAGANAFVAGSFLFKVPDMKAAIDDMRRSLAEIAP